MAKVWVRSRQAGLVAMHHNPRFKIRFDTTDPIEVDEDVAKQLVTNDTFEIVDPKAKKKSEGGG